MRTFIYALVTAGAIGATVDAACMNDGVGVVFAACVAAGFGIACAYRLATRR